MTKCETVDWTETEAALSALITAKRRADGANWEDAYSMSQHYLQRLGLLEALKSMRVLHIAGTKGKGSTAAFTNAILLECGYTVGLFTSPHLCDVRERCRINGNVASKEDFSRVFWECHTALLPRSAEDPPLPGYFRFLTYLSLKLFVEAQLDVVVLEVGLGGRLDATNVIPAPVATAVSTLDYDHVELLGDTLTLIAREKAGIFKAGVPAFTCSQEEEAMLSLRAVAKKVGCSLTVVDETFSQLCPSGSPPKLGLHGSFQKKNAAIATALCGELDAHVATSAAPAALSQEALRQEAARRARELKGGELPQEHRSGLAACRFSGRAQIAHVPVSVLPCFPPPESGGSPQHEPGSYGPIHDGHHEVSFYLDGAHTPVSAEECAVWFHAASSSPASSPSSSQQPSASDERILIFNCQDTRDPAQLLQPFSLLVAAPSAPADRSCAATPSHAAASRPTMACMFDHAMFVPADSVYSSLKKGRGDAVDVGWQLQSAHEWEALLHATGPQTSGPLRPDLSPGVRDSLKLSLGRGAVHTGQCYSVHSSLKNALACLRCRAGTLGGGSGRLHVLVTGSLHLVGDVLRHLGLAPV